MSYKVTITTGAESDLDAILSTVKNLDFRLERAEGA